MAVMCQSLKKFSYLFLIMGYMFLSKVNVANEDNRNFKYIARKLKVVFKDPPSLLVTSAELPITNAHFSNHGS